MSIGNSAIDPKASLRYRTWAVVAVLLTALLFDLLFFTGFIASDDVKYYAAASRLVEGEKPDFASWGSHRYPVVLPIAAVMSLRDPFLPATNVVFLVYHLLLVSLVFALATKLSAYTAGLVASVFTAICPLMVRNASMALPDIPMACLVLVSLLLLLQCAESFQAARVWQGHWLAASAGAVLMLACTAKLSALLVLPVFALFVLGRGWRVKRIQGVLAAASFGVGFLVLLCLDELLLRLFYANVNEGRILSLLKMADGYSQAGLDTQGLLRPGDRAATLIRNLRDGLGDWFFFLLILPPVVYPFSKGRSWLVFGTFVWGALYRSFGSVSLSQYAPHALQARYFILYVVLSFTMLGVIVADSSLLERRRRSMVAILLSVAGGSLLFAGARLNRLDYGTYFQGTVEGTRKAMETVRSSFPDRVTIMSPSYYWRMWPLFKTDSEGIWFLSSASQALQSPDHWPAEFFYIHDSVLADRGSTSKMEDLLLQAGNVREMTHRFSELCVRQELMGVFYGPQERLSFVTYRFLGGGLPGPPRRNGQAVYLWRVRTRNIGQQRDQKLEITNPGFEAWEEGRPSDWLARYGDFSGIRPHRGNHEGELVAALSGGNLDYHYLYKIFPIEERFIGRFLVAEASLWSDQPGVASLSIFAHDKEGRALNPSGRTYHPGDAKWHRLRATFQVPIHVDVGSARIVLESHELEVTVLFDDASLYLYESLSSGDGCLASPKAGF